MSDARNLGETAIVRERGQPSAEIVRVGCAKPRRNCDCMFACLESGLTTKNMVEGRLAICP